MANIERLYNYHDFDEAIVNQLGETAEWQNGKSFRELADLYNLADGPVRDHPYDDGQVIESITINPSGDFDETRRRVLWSPMGTPVNQSMTMRAIRMFAADPNHALTVIGSPASIGNSANRPGYTDLLAIRNGHFSALVSPALKQLSSENVSDVEHVGYSLGADLAASATYASSYFGLKALRSVFAEPASVVGRGPLKLIHQFGLANRELQRYVDGCDSQPLREARAAADTGVVRYIGGLLRPTNVAIGLALSDPGFEVRVDHALVMNTSRRVSLVWGTASELCDDAAMRTIVDNLQLKHGPDYVRPLPMRGMHHAGGDDIDLHAAMMLQGLREVA